MRSRLLIDNRCFTANSNLFAPNFKAARPKQFRFIIGEFVLSLSLGAVTQQNETIIWEAN